MGCTKVIDVAPVARLRPVKCLLVQKILQHLVFTHAGRAQHVDVVTFVADSQPEAQGVKGAILSIVIVEVLEFSRITEGQGGWITMPIETIGG